MLTELEIADKTWKHPTGRLLPVLLRPIPLDQIPAVLKSVTLLEPEGNVPGSIAHAVHRIARARRRSWLIRAAVSLLAVAVAIGGWLLIELGNDTAGPAVFALWFSFLWWQ